MEGLLVWLETWKAYLGATAAIATALAVLWKYLWPLLKSSYESVRFMYNARAYQATIDGKLDTIMLQLVPNGGSSIKDSLNRIEAKQDYFGGMIRAQANTSEKATFETDDKGMFVWVNRAHSRLTGFQPVEFMGKGWINIVAPECRTRVMRQWEDAIEAGREFDEDVWFIKTNRTTRYLVNVHAYMIPGRNKEIKGYFGEVSIRVDTPERQEPISREECERLDLSTF